MARLVNDGCVIRRWTSAAETVKEQINARLWDEDRSLYWDNDINQEPDSLHPQDGNSWAVITGVADGKRAAAISESLRARWIRPYGAPAPEAGNTVSPFASGFELRAHYLAGFPERAIELMEMMWADHMLDNPAMTNSTFVEGYQASETFDYPPYNNAAGVSHAHGWATTPTFALTFLGVGLQIKSALGRTWAVAPLLGTLKRATAGYETALGQFSASWTNETGLLEGVFKTPLGTSGSLTLPSVGHETLHISGAGIERNISADGKTNIVLNDLEGGEYVVKLA